MCDCDHSEFPGHIFKSMPDVDYGKWASLMTTPPSPVAGGKKRGRRRRRAGGAVVEGKKRGGFVTVVSGVVMAGPFLAVLFVVLFLFLNLG